MKKVFIYSFILLGIFVIPIICSARPIWVVNPNINKTNVDPEEPIEIRIYISGEGKISKNRLFIYSDKSVLFRDEDSENRAGYIFVKFDNELFNKKIEKTEGLELSQAETGIGGDIISETDDGLKTYSSVSPIYRVEAIPEEDGDHELRFVFIYSGDGNQYFIDEKEIKFHVRTGFERNQIWIYAVIILIAILGLFFNEEFKSFIKNLIRDWRDYHD